MAARGCVFALLLVLCVAVASAQGFGDLLPPKVLHAARTTETLCCVFRKGPGIISPESQRTEEFSSQIHIFPPSSTSCLPGQRLLFTPCQKEALFMPSICSACCAPCGEESNKIKIDVYYESLCPDSKRFFLKHLWPVYNQLSSYMNVNLIPYGNADTLGKQGEHTFKCQHGPEECLGNIIQVCFITLINETAESIKFINCAFNYDTQAQSINQCIKSKKLQKTVQKCAESSMGGDYLSEMGKKTDALQPPHTFIPWITFNGVGSRDINDKANRNFLESVCERITGDKPEYCQETKHKSFYNRGQRYRPIYL